MHSPEWQRQSCILQPIQTLSGKSGRKHDTGIHPQIGSHGTSRTYSYPYIHRIQSTSTPSGRPAQVGKPQCPQFKPCVCSRVPIIITHSACKMLSASRRKNFIPCSSTIATIFSDSFLMSSPVTSAAQSHQYLFLSVPCAQQSAFALPRQAHVRGGNPVHSVS